MKAIKSLLAILISLLLVQNVIAATICGTTYASEATAAVALPGPLTPTFGPTTDIPAPFFVLSTAFPAPAPPLIIAADAGGCITANPFTALGNKDADWEHALTNPIGTTSKELAKGATVVWTLSQDSTFPNILHADAFNQGTGAFVIGYTIQTPAASFGDFHNVPAGGDDVIISATDADGSGYVVRLDTAGPLPVWENDLAGGYTQQPGASYEPTSGVTQVLFGDGTWIINFEANAAGAPVRHITFDGDTGAPNTPQAIFAINSDDAVVLYIDGAGIGTPEAARITGLFGAATLMWNTNLAPGTQTNGVGRDHTIVTCNFSNLCFLFNYPFGPESAIVYELNPAIGNEVSVLDFPFIGGFTLGGVAGYGGDDVLAYGDSSAIGEGIVTASDLALLLGNWGESVPAINTVQGVAVGATEIAITGLGPGIGSNDFTIQDLDTATGIVLGGVEADLNSALGNDEGNDVVSISGDDFIALGRETTGADTLIVRFGPEAVVAPVPEFGSIALLLAALVALGGIFIARRRFA